MTLREQITKAAFRFIARQLLVVVIAAGLLAAVFGFAGFCAALVGGLICGVVPNLLATVMVYYKQTYQRPSRMLLRFLLAELVKISLSAGLFLVVVLSVPGIRITAMFIGLVVALFCVWLSPLMAQPQTMGVEHAN